MILFILFDLFTLDILLDKDIPVGGKDSVRLGPTSLFSFPVLGFLLVSSLNLNLLSYSVSFRLYSSTVRQVKKSLPLL